MCDEITAPHQAIRNANDATSVIKAADCALSVVDVKLVRMKELGMQASTSESHISAVDVSLEMSCFVRKQILTQAVVAMLYQANSLH